MTAQMLPAVFELIPDEADPIQVGAHGEPLIVRLRLAGRRRFLRQRLMIQRQSQHDVGANQPRMELAAGIARCPCIKASQLDGMMTGEKSVKVTKLMIS